MKSTCCYQMKIYAIMVSYILIMSVSFTFTTSPPLFTTKLINICHPSPSCSPCEKSLSTIKQLTIHVLQPMHTTASYHCHCWRLLLSMPLLARLLGSEQPLPVQRVAASSLHALGWGSIFVFALTREVSGGDFLSFYLAGGIKCSERGYLVPAGAA